MNISEVKNQVKSFEKAMIGYTRKEQLWALSEMQKATHSIDEVAFSAATICKRRMARKS